MEGERDDLQRQLDDLSDRVSVNRSDIDAIEGRAVSDRQRGDQREAQSDANHKRIDELEARGDVDRDMIAELQADGIVSTEHAEQMEEALRSSRVIGAAIGILMASRQVDDVEAFAILTKASQHTNRKLRDLAADVVHAGGAGDLPAS